MIIQQWRKYNKRFFKPTYAHSRYTVNQLNFGWYAAKKNIGAISKTIFKRSNSWSSKQAIHGSQAKKKRRKEIYQWLKFEEDETLDWTQKWGFSWKVHSPPPADIILNESLPPKSPCDHHVHGRHGHSSPVKNRWRFSKFCEKDKTLSITLKSVRYLAGKWVWRAQIGFVWKLVSRTTHFVLQKEFVRPSTERQ